MRRVANALALAGVLVGFLSVDALPAVAQTPASAPVRLPPSARLSDLDLDCLIDAQSRVKLSAAVSGLVARVHVDRGDRVNAGQVLVEMESNVEEAQLRAARIRAANDQPVHSARAKLERAERTLERLTRLRGANAGALTQGQFDEAVSEQRVALSALRDAEAGMETARVEADRALAVLEQRRVVSPIDGVVVERNMQPGEHRNEQSHMLTLARIDPLHVEVFAPVALYGQTRVGAIARVSPEAPVGGSYEARVTVIDRVIDAASGTFGVRLALPNPNHEIPAGLRCRIRFEALPAR
jgi:RND family efflux transporter MFP subunit